MANSIFMYKEEWFLSHKWQANTAKLFEGETES